jgi:hypothetical protein
MRKPSNSAFRHWQCIRYVSHDNQPQCTPPIGIDVWQPCIINSKGRLRDLYESWREALMFSMANIEALIDFGDDEQYDDGHIIGTGVLLVCV